MLQMMLRAASTRHSKENRRRVILQKVSHIKGSSAHHHEPLRHNAPVQLGAATPFKAVALVPASRPWTNAQDSHPTQEIRRAPLPWSTRPVHKSSLGCGRIEPLMILGCQGSGSDFDQRGRPEPPQAAGPRDSEVDKNAAAGGRQWAARNGQRVVAASCKRPVAGGQQWAAGRVRQWSAPNCRRTIGDGRRRVVRSRLPIGCQW